MNIQSQVSVISDHRQIAMVIAEALKPQFQAWLENAKKELFDTDPLAGYPELMTNAQCAKVTGYKAFYHKAKAIGLKTTEGDKYLKEDVRKYFFGGK